MSQVSDVSSTGTDRRTDEQGREEFSPYIYEEQFLDFLQSLQGITSAVSPGLGLGLARN